MHLRGQISVILMLVIVVAFGVILVGGQFTNTNDTNSIGNPVSLVNPTISTSEETLQLYTIAFTTVIPTQPQATSTPIQSVPTATPAQSTPTPTTPPIQPPVNPPNPPVNPPNPPPPPQGNKCQLDAPLPQNSSCQCPGFASKLVFCNGSPCAATNPGPSSLQSTRPELPAQCVFYKNNPHYNEFIDHPNCTIQCYAKPVIYLYPELLTDVTVKLTIPGVVTVSDPIYPPETGWRNVLAYPNGQLFYQGNTYPYLYYETSVTKTVTPPNGIVIPTWELEKRLRENIRQLGLNRTEQNDFLDYWLPELYKLDTPYILFSILTPAQKELVDHVDITPKPDTVIEFLAYFKPLREIVFLPPLVMPKEIPQRIGFTAVEWGGRIDTNK